MATNILLFLKKIIIWYSFSQVIWAGGIPYQTLKTERFCNRRVKNMRYFFIEPAALQKPIVTIEGSEVRHIKNVLRLQPGDQIRLFDGEGFEYEATIRRFLANRIEIKITHKSPGTKESPLKIVVAQALLKEKKMDRLLRHLCELGVTQWIPFISERSVPRPDPKRLPVRIERWNKIVKESLKQCRRTTLPEISETLTFEEVMSYGRSCDLMIIFYENESASLNSIISSSPQPIPQKILLIMGPEGGFSDQEIANAKADGCRVAGLGPRILRAETATLAACTLFQYLFGDMG
jgi:16S rRNA (uracil1498-N3)-methyltransferase